ncbi:hypothetical protein BN1088_1432029 [Sphingobacterium sp. PM2-P1-29]|nr:hypothetical protein BN1088_1432029 [Sphingobacterium sp. PM2-P1-29]
MWFKSNVLELSKTRRKFDFLTKISPKLIRFVVKISKKFKTLK